MLITLTLLITLAQQPAQPPTLPPDHQVALVLSTGTEFARLDDSQRLYEAIEAKRLAGTWNDDDKRLHAALTQALGTLPDYDLLTAPGLPGSRERLDWEVRRGVRKATQRADRE